MSPVVQDISDLKNFADKVKVFSTSLTVSFSFPPTGTGLYLHVTFFHLYKIHFSMILIFNDFLMIGGMGIL